MKATIFAGIILASLAAAADELVIVVVDPSGAPLTDARIEVRKPSEAPSPVGGLVLRTYADGKFRLPEPDPGRYVVDVFQAAKTGPYRFGRVSHEFDVPHQGPVRVVLPGERLFEVSGLLVDTEGELAWGRYLVEAHPVGVDTEARPLAAPVDRNGGFVLHGLSRGVYELRVARLDVKNSTFGRGFRALELDVSEDVKGLRLSARAPR